MALDHANLKRRATRWKTAARATENGSLREARVAARLTQGQLAHRAGVSARTVLRAENGGRVSEGSWALLAAALGVRERGDLRG